MPGGGPLLTRAFVLVCLATGFFYLSFYLILPVMPLYVADLEGTSTQIGLIIGYFAFMSMLLRPLAGAAVFGIGFGMAQPALMALTTDRRRLPNRLVPPSPPLACMILAAYNLSVDRGHLVSAGALPHRRHDP